MSAISDRVTDEDCAAIAAIVAEVRAQLRAEGHVLCPHAGEARAPGEFLAHWLAPGEVCTRSETAS